MKLYRTSYISETLLAKTLQAQMEGISGAPEDPGAPEENPGGLDGLLDGIDEHKDMRSIRVTFDDGDTIDTQINGTMEDILKYYLENDFTKSDETSTHRGVNVEFFD